MSQSLPTHSSLSSVSRARLLDDLRQQMTNASSDWQRDSDWCDSDWQCDSPLQRCAPHFSTGSPALDRLLPGNGLRPGTIVEWLAPFAGSGAGTLALLAARQVCGGPSVFSAGESSADRLPRRGSTLVVVDDQHQFYPPAALAWGIDPANLLLVRPQNQADALWAATQALACEAVAAVWATWGRLDPRAARRLQLAAKRGQTLGVFLRPRRAAGRPSWAQVQLLVMPRRLPIAQAPVGSQEKKPLKRQVQRESESRCVEIRVLRCHGRVPTRSVYLKIDPVTGDLKEVAGPLRPQLPEDVATRKVAL